MWEKISAEVRLTHAEQISLYNFIVLGKNNRHSWRLNKSSKKFWIIENLWVFRNWIRVNKFIFRTCNLTENELCSKGAFTLQFSDNFFNCRKVWFRVNDVNNYFCHFMHFSYHFFLTSTYNFSIIFLKPKSIRFQRNSRGQTFR